MADSQEKAFLGFNALPENFTWSDISKEYQAFSVALLYWKTGLDRDVVSDYVNQFVTNKDEYPKLCIAPKPIFIMDDPIRELFVDTSMGTKSQKIDLSRTIYFCPKHIWNKEENGMDTWIGNICFANAKDLSYSVTMRCPEMEIVDQMSMVKGDFPVKTLPIQTYGVYSTQQCAIWRYEPNNPYKKPKAWTCEPSALVISDGSMFFKENFGC